MLNVRIIAVGGLKEDYLRAAAAEYIKRLGAFCSTSVVEIKEAKLPASPSDAQVGAAIAEEGARILAAVPPRAYVVPLAIEGSTLTSEELAGKIETAAGSYGSLCFVIGGSYGLDPSVKAAGNLSLSLSRLTFPHQLTRIILLEALYRSFGIIKGTKYHK